MRIIDKLFRRNTVVKEAISPITLKTPEASLVDGYKSPKLKQEEYLKEIKGWTFSCINAIADQIGFIKLRLMEVKTNGEIVEVNDGEILDSLHKINDFTTKFDHFWLTAVYLEAVGEAPWFLDKDDQGKIIGIYVLDPARVTPVFSREGGATALVDHYEFDLGQGKSIPIPAHQIIPLKIPDPANPLRGMGTMKAVARSIDIENASESWNFNFFKNNASPGVKLKINTPNLSEEQRNKLKTQIKRQYQGVDKSQQMWVLFDGMDVEPFGTSQKDMDFMEQQKWTANKIRGIFRVPKTILAQSDDVNLANAKSAESVFIKYTIKPKLERIIQQLNEFLIPQFSNDNTKFFLDFVDPLEEDRELELKTYENALKNGWMTINEVRNLEGLPNYGKEGDNIYVPLNVMVTPVKTVKKGISRVDRVLELNSRTKKSLDTDALTKELARSIKQIMVKGLRKKETKIVKVVENTVKKEVVQFTQEQKEAFWEKKAIIFDKHMPEYKKIMDDIFKEQEKEVIADIKKQKDIKADSNKVLLNKKKEAKRFNKFFVPIATLIMKDSSEETFDFLGLDLTLDVDGPEIQRYIDSRVLLSSLSTTDTTNQAIKLAFAEGVAEGESVTQLSKRIAGLFDSARDYRSDRVARSEVTRFNVDATERSYIDSGIVEGKEWIINPGACPICIPLAGKVIGLGEPYFKRGDETTTSEGESFDLNYEDIDHPPIHVNCRCDLAPVFQTSKDVDMSIVKLKKEMSDNRNFDLQKMLHDNKVIREKVESSIKDGIDDIREKASKEIKNKINEVIDGDEFKDQISNKIDNLLEDE